MYRLLIVDDESVIRNGLVSLIQWDSIGFTVVGEAANGLEAIDRIESLSPHVVITDVKMPGASGVELAKYVHENKPDIKVIILTGYADFEYARFALKYNVFDFLLKPTEPEQLVGAVVRAMGDILQKQQAASTVLALKKEVSKYESTLKEKEICDAIKGVLTGSAASGDRLSGLGLSLMSYYFICLEADTEKSDAEPPPQASLHKVGGFLSAAFKAYTHFIVPMTAGNLSAIVSCGEADDERSGLLDICRKLHETILSLTGLSVFVGISDRHTDIRELSAACREARLALEGRFYSVHVDYFYMSSGRASLPEGSPAPSPAHSDLEQVRHILQNRESDRLADCIQTMFGSFLREKRPIDEIKNAAIRICSMIDVALLDHGLCMADCLGKNENLYRDILGTDRCEQLIRLLRQVAVKASEKLRCCGGRNNMIISGAIEYIRQNYDQAITLRMVAEHIHVNASYLSRLFKRATSGTFTDMLHKVRIEKAKELLLNSDLNVFEVADTVGIPDPAYFSVVFKRITGVSPKHYSYRSHIYEDEP